MIYKLNSYKVFKDNWPTFVLGMIVALFTMLAIWCRWNNFTEYKAESETETAWTAEVRQPGMIVEDELGEHQLMPTILVDEEHERFKELAAAYNIEASKIWQVENHYWIKEGIILCITIAETSWGYRWYWKSNPWNVWNNDRWDRVQYAFFETWLEKIGQTLTNKYLWKKKTLWCLSNAGSCSEAYDNGSRYATSDGNWERNMVACLSTIYGRIDPATFSIRR